MAIERVKTRVLEGGHNIETQVIKRRYVNGIKNLFNIYLSIVDEVLIYDNSHGISELIAAKKIESEVIVLNELKFNKLKMQYYENR